MARGFRGARAPGAWAYRGPVRPSPGSRSSHGGGVIELDGEPCELTDTYYPAAIARGTAFARTGRIRGGAVALLAELGHIGARVREDVNARMPDESERPVEAMVMVKAGHLYELRYEITPE